MSEHELKNAGKDRKGVLSVNGWCVLQPGETRTVDLSPQADHDAMRAAGITFTADKAPAPKSGKGKAGK